MDVNPLASPSRSRPNPTISVRKSSAACRASEKNIVPETKTLLSPIN